MKPKQDILGFIRPENDTDKIVHKIYTETNALKNQMKSSTHHKYSANT